MVRPLRIEFEGACYHVMNRGRGRCSVYPGDDYYLDYLQCLEEAHKRFGIEVHAYCLMGNHYHLMVKTPRGNLSRAMRHIDGVYTQRYNRRKGMDGALFRGRYKAIWGDEAFKENARKHVNMGREIDKQGVRSWYLWIK